MRDRVRRSCGYQRKSRLPSLPREKIPRGKKLKRFFPRLKIKKRKKNRVPKSITARFVRLSKLKYPNVHNNITTRNEVRVSNLLARFTRTRCKRTYGELKVKRYYPLSIRVKVPISTDVNIIMASIFPLLRSYYLRSLFFRTYTLPWKTSVANVFNVPTRLFPVRRNVRGE